MDDRQHNAVERVRNALDRARKRLDSIERDFKEAIQKQRDSLDEARRALAEVHIPPPGDGMPRMSPGRVRAVLEGQAEPRGAFWIARACGLASTSTKFADMLRRMADEGDIRMVETEHGRVYELDRGTDE